MERQQGVSRWFSSDFLSSFLWLLMPTLAVPHLCGHMVYDATCAWCITPHHTHRQLCFSLVVLFRLGIRAFCSHVLRCHHGNRKL